MTSRLSWALLVTGTLTAAGCLQVLGLGDYRDGATGGSASTSTTSPTTSTTNPTSSTGSNSGGAGGGPVSCTPGQSYPCYSGPPGTENNGMCHAGTHVCDNSGMAFGMCTGEQLPQAEICSTPADEDCNGFACGETAWAHGYPTGVFGIGPTFVASAPDGSIYVAFTLAQAFMLGGTPLIPTGTSSGALARFDAQGNVLWAKNLGTSVYSVAANATGPVVHVGGQIIRFDANGTQLWTATCGSSWGGVVSFDGQGNVLDGATVGDGALDCGIGAIANPATGFSKILLSKFSPTGVAQWGVLLKSTQDAVLYDGKADSAGNILFAGYATGTVNWGLGHTTNGYDAFVAKYSPTGTHVWSSFFGGAGYQEAHSIGVDSLGNPVIGGYFGGTIDFGGGPMTAPGTDQYAFVAKLGNFGTYQWAHAYAGSNQDITGIALDSNDAVAIVGTSTGPTDLGGGPLNIAAGKLAGFAAKVDKLGGYSWGRLLSPSGGASQMKVTVDPLGFFDATGLYFGTPFDPGTGPLPGGGMNTFVARIAP